MATAMPEHVVPMFARLSALPRDDDRFGYEVKWDGVRGIAYVRDGRLRLESRNLKEVTIRYPEIGPMADALAGHAAVLDGEVVAFDEQGRPSFERLQHRMHLTGSAAIARLARQTPVIYMVFDLLWLDGALLMGEPYVERRERLEALALEGPAWRTPGYHSGDGASLLEASRRQGLEGIVAKRLDSTYEPGRRGGSWLKVKNSRRQELVIGGWVPGEGRRRDRIGALLVGFYEGDELRWAGKVGTGFDDRELERLGRLLASRERSTSPFSGRQPERAARFVEPDLVAEVEFTEWTDRDMLRHSSYKGLRDDNRALDVVLEKPA